MNQPIGIFRPYLVRIAAAQCLLIVATGTAIAGDWPQILGPHRNGQAHDEKLLRRWPKDGPRIRWRYKVDSGYAGPAVVGKRVIVFHRVGDVERIEALDADTGEQVWKVDFDASYRGSFNPDHGPRCVPVVHDDHVYVLGAAGDLHSVTLTTGKTRWSRGVYQEFGAKEGYFGAGSTPIVSNGKLLVSVGGSKAGIVAFALDTGRPIWTAPPGSAPAPGDPRSDEASYSSPVAATVNGLTHVIFVTRLNVLSIDPANGDLRFQFPFGKRGLTVTAATPLVFDSHLFVSASYGIGAKMVQFDGKGVQTLWSNDSVMSSQYTTGVYHQGYLYGTHGREDAGVGVLRCVDEKSGMVQWSVEGFGVAHLIVAGDILLILKASGQLVLAEASPKAFRELASANLAVGTTRALPALSEGCLYLRSNNGNRGEVMCIVVGQSPR